MSGWGVLHSSALRQRSHCSLIGSNLLQSLSLIGISAAEVPSSSHPSAGRIAQLAAQAILGSSDQATQAVQAHVNGQPAPLCPGPYRCQSAPRCRTVFVFFGHVVHYGVGGLESWVVSGGGLALHMAFACGSALHHVVDRPVRLLLAVIMSPPMRWPSRLPRMSKITPTFRGSPLDDLWWLPGCGNRGTPLTAGPATMCPVRLHPDFLLYFFIYS